MKAKISVCVVVLSAVMMAGETSFAQLSGSVPVPEGVFTMGCQDGAAYDGRELPAHAVFISSFYMDQYEVTKALWDGVYQWAILNSYGFSHPGLAKALSHPVETVDWYDCVKWCNARSEMEGLTPCYYTDSGRTVFYRSGNINLSSSCVDWSANGYRLPTEAEWEKAARGGATGARFPWSNTSFISQTMANYAANGLSGSSSYDLSYPGSFHPAYAVGGTPFTSPVGSFAPNGYGLYDMAGNIDEWCWDWYNATWYGQVDATAPNPRGPGSSPIPARVVRGGRWSHGAYECRVAFRNYDRAYDSANSIGFRCVRASVPASIVIVTQPTNQYCLSGSNVTFSVLADGLSPLKYQWQFDGHAINNATNTILSLNSVSRSNSGCYSVKVSNAVGYVIATAYLSVLAPGGDAGEQIIAPVFPARQAGKDNLVLVTHGWMPVPFASPSWMNDMTNAITQYLAVIGNNDWQVETLDWLSYARTPRADRALANGIIIGSQIGRQIGDQVWQHVHLIGHSAGAGLVQAVVDEIRYDSPTTEIHATFLDPFVGFGYRGRTIYGANTDWADNYFAHDFTDTLFNYTSGVLSNAHNVNVSWLDPNASAGLGDLPSSSHGWPHDFYIETVTNRTPGCAGDYGFLMSKEGGGWNERGNYSIGNEPTNLCGVLESILDSYPTTVEPPLNITFVPKASSDFGVTLSSDRGFAMSITVPSRLQTSTWTGGIEPLDNGSDSSTNGAWLAIGLNVSNLVNFVQFDAYFTSTNTAEGLMTIYWNTNELGAVDERAVSLGLQTHRFPLPYPVTNGFYTLSFRFDAFNNKSSSIVVTNVSTGFIGVTQPITLNLSLGTNSTPVLRLIGATNFTYLVQTSTNLVDWTPTALLQNTNGTVQYIDSSWTNSAVRFYRAVLP